MNVISRIDYRAMVFVQSKMQKPFLDKVMPTISKLGNGGMIWIAISFSMLFSAKYRTVGRLVLLALAIGVMLASIIIKPVVCRMRPCDVFERSVLIKRPTDYSFPSGHSLSSFAAATILFHYNIYFGIAALVLASLIAFSRLYLFVHYPSDIAAGILLGLSISVVARMLWLAI